MKLFLRMKSLALSIALFFVLSVGIFHFGFSNEQSDTVPQLSQSSLEDWNLDGLESFFLEEDPLLTHVSAQSSKLVYHYKIRSLSKTEFDQLWQDQGHPIRLSVASKCRDEEFKPLLHMDIVIGYQYVGRFNQSLLEFEVTKNDCVALS